MCGALGREEAPWHPDQPLGLKERWGLLSCRGDVDLCAAPELQTWARLGWNLDSLLSMCLKVLSLGDLVKLRHCDSKVGSPGELGSCFLWILRTSSGPGDDYATAATPSGWWCLELRVTTESWPSRWIRTHLCNGAGLAHGCLSCWDWTGLFRKCCLSPVCHHPVSAHSREWAENLARSTVHCQVGSPGSPLV